MALDNLAAIIEDVEDLMAERMEKSLRGGWTSWRDYRVRNRHTGIFPGTIVEVRFRFPGSLEMAVEVRRKVGKSLEYFEPDLMEWFFPDLESEDDARARVGTNAPRLPKPF